MNSCDTEGLCGKKNEIQEEHLLGNSCFTFLFVCFRGRDGEGGRYFTSSDSLSQCPQQLLLGQARAGK